jgi:aryl-alcohol dehydrogenase-like predicted oxidoreductase
VDSARIVVDHTLRHLGGAPQHRALVIDRRALLSLGVTSASLAVVPRWLHAAPTEWLTRPIPSTGERLPVIGLGSAASFEQSANHSEIQGLTEVLRLMIDRGAKVFDTAPSYGASEAVAGRIAKELGIAEKIFWATKTEPSYGRDDSASARAAVQESFKRLGVKKIDLIQVHNLGNLQTKLTVLKDLKSQGVIRYVGVTTTFSGQYSELLKCMRNERIDFIGVDYSIEDREVEKEILPLAIERGIAVMGYVPFGRSNLFKRVAGAQVPDWAQEAGMKTWAQFFLKFVIGHPAMTVVTPATSQPNHMLEDLSGGIGALPDEPMRKRMIAALDNLPRG